MSLIEADALCATLEANGIRSFVPDQGAVSASPLWPVRVWFFAPAYVGRHCGGSILKMPSLPSTATSALRIGIGEQMTHMCKRLLALALILSLGAPRTTSASNDSAELAASLKTHVLKLTGTEAPRSYKHMESLDAAADYVEAEFRRAGITTKTQAYEAKGKTFRNIVCRIDVGSAKTVLLGAHYDVYGRGPGADDNASGVAGLIELARILNANKEKLRYSVEIIAFTNEEPPFFQTKEMGSYVHAQSIRSRKGTIAYMVVLEMIGFYSERAGTQDYPIPAMRQLYPSAGNFIAVVGNSNSANEVASIKQAIQKNAAVDCQSLIAPPALRGMDFSDHFNYWALGLKAVMITDTAFYRNRNYHQPTDTPATLDYSKMAEVVNGLAASFYRATP